MSEHGMLRSWIPVACLSISPLVMAQESTVPEPAPAEASSAEAPADTAASDEGGIAEIIVTAQRREQNLQDVPISISAVTAETMETMGVEDTTALAAVSPGLNITRQWGSVTPYIRGVGTPLVLGGNESAVALYVDGIYVPQLAALTFSFNNIQRVEVLKGPQGTLFGRNATGGLIHVVTRDPTGDPAFIANTSFDNFQTTETSVYGSTGLAENLAGDLSIYYADQNEGYGTNQFDGKDVYDREELGLRTSLLYTAGATRARLSLDYSDTESSLGVARQADRGARTVDGQGPQKDYWDTNLNWAPSNVQEGWGTSLKLTHDLENMQVVSLTGYRSGNNRFRADQDATPLSIIDAIIDDEATTLSQELQLQSTGAGPLNWIVGLYYFNFDVDYYVDTSASSPISPLAAIGGTQIVESTLDTTSIAAYAQATYALNERSNLTLGVRYTDDDREFKGSFSRPNAPAPIPTFASGTSPKKESSGEATWRVAFDHKFNDDVLGYASYNRGFKSGVYNMINPNDLPVNSELVDAYELGLKTDLLDRRLRLNTAAFYYDYQDLQVQTINQGSVILFNAKKAEIMGAEIELQALPTDRLELTAGLSLLSSEYKDFPNADITEPVPPGRMAPPFGGNWVCKSGQAVASPSCPEDVRVRLSGQSAEGNDVTRAPDFTASLSGRYGIPVASGEIGVGGSLMYNGGFYWEPDNRAEQDAYTLINAQLDWRSADRRYRVYAFGKNLGDEEYSQFLSGGSLGDIVSAAPPRTYGLGAEIRFE